MHKKWTTTNVNQKFNEVIQNMQFMKKFQTWGTVVAFSAFMIQVITFGIGVSIGVYNIALLEHFQSSVAAISVIGAINIGLFLGGGPLASFMMRKMSYRHVALLGSFMSSAGLLCCPFAPNILYLSIFYSVITGIGFCLVYVPSHTLSGLYFDKHRSLITGLVTSGSGLGGAIFPIITHYAIQEYGWRGSMLIMAGVNMNNFVFSLLLRPAPIQIRFLKEEAQPLQNNSQPPEHSADKLAAEAHPIETSLNELLEEHTLDSHENKDILDNKVTKIPGNGEKQLKHCYVLCDFAFLIYWVSNIMWNMGSSTVVVLGPEYFTEIGLTKKEAALAITSYNALIVIGGCVGGAVGNLKYINRIYFYAVCSIFTGVFTFALAVEYFHNFTIIAVDMALVGLAFGMLLGLLVVVTADLLGVQSLGDGMGYLMLANGIGNAIGPPLGGALRDYIYSYLPSFYIAGIVTILAGIIMFALPLRKWICHKKN